MVRVWLSVNLKRHGVDCGGPSGASVPGHARTGLERGRILATICIPGGQTHSTLRATRVGKSLATELDFEGHMKWAERVLVIAAGFASVLGRGPGTLGHATDWLGRRSEK